jgi:hypothetical protein
MILRRRNRDTSGIDPRTSITMAGFQNLDYINRLDDVVDAVVQDTAQLIATTIVCVNLQRRRRTHSISMNSESPVTKNRRRNQIKVGTPMQT